MCAHACSFHKKKGSHRTPCCTPCDCGQNIELIKLNDHRADCHRVGLDVPRTSFNGLTPPPVKEREPAYAKIAA
jgi:hypothetical protein